MGSLLQTLDLPELLVVLALTVLPSILLLMLILFSDRRSREPVLMLIICILSGAFTISLSLILDKIILKAHLIGGDLFTSANSYSVYRILMLAGVEEYAKLLVLFLFLYRNKSFDDIYDGFVYSAIISLSFSVGETFIYVFNETTYGDMTSLAILRNLTSIPLHITCGILMGYFVSLQKFSKSKKRRFLNMFLALAVPTFIHTLYNVFFSVVSLSNTNNTVIMIILFILSIYFIGIMYIIRIHSLNKIFINNGVYPKLYSYLMNKSEFITGGGGLR